MTRDIKAAFIAEIDSLKTMDEARRNLHIDYLISELHSSLVSVTVRYERCSPPVPAYDAKEDGDYGDWLVANNID